MPVTIVSSAFADPFSNSVNYYRSNAGDKMLMRMRVKERIEVVSGATAYLSLNPIDNIITWTGGNWEDEGFRYGDQVGCFKYSSGGSLIFAWTATVQAVNGDQLDLDTIPTWIDAQQGQIMRVLCGRKRQGLIVDFNHVQNGQAGNEYSVIDNEVTRFSFDMLNNSGSIAGVPIGHQSGQYIMNAILVEIAISTGERVYDLVVDFINSGITAPSLYNAGDCIKFYAKMRWQTLLGEPFHNNIVVYNNDADTGWYDEAFNLGTPTSVLMQGINQQLDYLNINSCSVVIDVPSGASIQLGFGGSYCPDDDLYYKNQNQPQQDLSMTIGSQIISSGTTLGSPQNPQGAYWKAQIVNIQQLGTQYQIDLVLDFMNAIAFFDAVQDGDRRFKIWIKADNVNHLVYDDQLIKQLPVGGPLDMKQNTFLYHNQNVDSSVDTLIACEANIEDDIAFAGTWMVPVNSLVDNVYASIECYNDSTGDSFVLGSVLFDYSGIPLQSGVYPVNLQIPVITTLPDTSMKLEAILVRDASYDTGSEYGMRILFPFFLRWEYWLQQLNASGDFFPTQNKNWYQYGTGLNDWYLRYRMTSDIDGLTYYFEDKVVMKNYDSDDNISQDIQLYLFGQNVQVVTEGQQMIVEATHKVTNGEAWKQSTVWGMITVEPKESAPRSICSTVVPFDNDVTNPLTPFAGSQLAELSFPSPEIAVIRCNFDPDKIDLTNGVKFTTKIKGCFEEMQEVVQKLKTDGTPKQKTDGSPKYKC